MPAGHDKVRSHQKPRADSDLFGALDPAHGPFALSHVITERFHIDKVDGIGANDCLQVLGPGLGVTYDWDFIERNRHNRLVFGAAK